MASDSSAARIVGLGADRPRARERTRYFALSTDPRVTACPAWQSLVQFRHELLTNPRQDYGLVDGSGFWHRWIETMHHFLSGADERQAFGYYWFEYPRLHPACIVRLDRVVEYQAAAFADPPGLPEWLDPTPIERMPTRARGSSAPAKPCALTPDEIADQSRYVLFPAGANYFGPIELLDRNLPFPELSERALIVEWVESWIDAIQYREATGRFLWEGSDAPSAEGSASTPAPARADAGAEHPLTEDHERILAWLGKTPGKCQTVLDVASLGPIRNRETAGNLLRDLERFGLVDRPHGKRKGYALTGPGRERAARTKPT